MFPIPDLSYFAVPGFINQMRARNVHSTSLILNDGSSEEWDQALSSENPFLYNWLHERTGKTHDVYLPFTAQPFFMHEQYKHMVSVIQPAQLRIRTFLTQMGVTDVEEYLADSEEWLYVLFADKASHYAAAEIAAQAFHIPQGGLPAVVIWQRLDDRRVITLLPNSNIVNAVSYIQSLYHAITEASEPTVRTLYLLMAEILRILDASRQEKLRERSFREIHIVQTDERISDVLIAIGAEYGRRFNDAIVSFEETMSVAPRGQSAMRFAQTTYRELHSKLEGAGFTLTRQGSHEIWRHPALRKPTPLPRHVHISSGVAKSVYSDIYAALGHL